MFKIQPCLWAKLQHLQETINYETDDDLDTLQITKQKKGEGKWHSCL